MSEGDVIEYRDAQPGDGKILIGCGQKFNIKNIVILF